LKNKKIIKEYMTNTIRIPKFKIKKEKIDSDKTVHIEYD